MLIYVYLHGWAEEYGAGYDKCEFQFFSDYSKAYEHWYEDSLNNWVHESKTYRKGHAWDEELIATHQRKWARMKKTVKSIPYNTSEWYEGFKDMDNCIEYVGSNDVFQLFILEIPM